MHSTKQRQPQASHNISGPHPRAAGVIYRRPPLRSSIGNQAIGRMLHTGGGDRTAGATDTSTAKTTAASRAVAALRGPGASLPTGLQRSAGRRYGHTFANVRIHTNARASAAAKELRASAFTLGNNIAFRDDRYAPDTLQGQLLLQHELRHAAQQRSAQPVSIPEIDAPNSQHELDARELFNPSVQSLPVQRIQCAPDDERFTIDGFANDLGEAVIGPTAWPFVKAVLEGFIGALQKDVKSGRADKAVDHLSGLLWPRNFGKFAGGYFIGMILGLVSPIVELVKGIIGIVHFGISVAQWLAKWSPMGIAVSPERQRKIQLLVQKFSELGAEFYAAWAEFISNPVGTIEKFSGFLGDMMTMALGKAREFGASAAHSIFEFLELGYYDMGMGIGKVIGKLVINLALFLFTGPVAKLITEGVSILGKLGGFVTGKLVGAFQGIRSFISSTVDLLRRAVKGALRIFARLLNKATEAFELLFADAAALVKMEEAVAAGVGRVPVAPPNILESRMLPGLRTSPATVADLKPPKVHPSNVGRSPGDLKGTKGPQSTAEAVEDLEKTGGGARPREAATIGTEIERIEVQDWAAELSKNGYQTYSRNRFGNARIGKKRVSSFFTDQRARPDMIAINEAEKTIIVGDITGSSATGAKIPGRIGQEPGLHIEKTIEYAKQLKRQLPRDSDYKVFAQDRHWQTGKKTKLIRIY